MTAAVEDLVERSARPEPKPAPRAAGVDDIVERCASVTVLLRAFESELSDEQKAALSGAVAEIRVAALRLGAV